METLVSLFATGWKNGLAVGDPKTNVPDLFRLVTVGLKTGIFAGLSTLFLVTPIDCKKINFIKARFYFSNRVGVGERRIGREITD